MMENGFSSPRSEAFPAGLRVLVVDDDPTWLKILEKMLKKCSYEVTTCGLARDALNLLRERKDGYDIVISDVNMPDMDGFKLLEHVGLEMDLPVIMMSVDGETSRVMKGVQHGACDYLLKPIRMKELRNIWQHVFRKKILEVRDIESLEGIETIQMSRNLSDLSDDGQLLCGDDVVSLKKRKDVEKKHDDKEVAENSSAKKARVVWSVDLHQKFVRAVNQIGFDKVGPKKILDLMNVPRLTRENVASHLQKYRLYLSRLQKENDIKSSVGVIKHSESPIRDAAGSIGIQNMINMQHNDVPKNTYGFLCHAKIVQSVNPRGSEFDRKGIGSIPASESKHTQTIDGTELCKPRSSQKEFGHFLKPWEPGVNLAACDRTFMSRGSWCAIPEIQMKQEHNPSCLDDGLKELPIPGQRLQMKADFIQQALPIDSGICTKERDVSGTETTKPLYEHRSNVSHVSKLGFTVNSSLLQAKTCIESNQAIGSISANPPSGKKSEFNLGCMTKLEPVPKDIKWGACLTSLDNDYKRNANLVSSSDSGINSSQSQTSAFMPNYMDNEPISSQAPSMKNQGFNLNCFADLESSQRCVDWGAPLFGASSDDLQVSWIQDDCYAMNLGLQNIDFSEYRDPALIGEVPVHLYDALKFDHVNSSDPTEYCVIDQSLFIA
ncbi:hypothetical protein K2173_002611 [Erythroxylum novogranatense]|uniref:Response regulatory domain-containing protein n=1 Tax=Erythroxylum novogranatense TaxID=1862640 RepID=A0AAV8SWJ8_9ROSI|nr:hypothetical protein K2173_002611 [Erythroxylum novogranatense]